MPSSPIANPETTNDAVLSALILEVSRLLIGWGLPVKDPWLVTSRQQVRIRIDKATIHIRRNETSFNVELSMQTSFVATNYGKVPISDKGLRPVVVNHSWELADDKSLAAMESWLRKRLIDYEFIH